MKIIKITIYIILLTFAFAACKYTLNSIDQTVKKTFISINASVTETYAKIEVEYSIDEISTNGGYTKPPKVDATAFITDSKGNKYVVKATGAIDTTFKGKVGETYILTVETDGKKYVSSPETMLPCPEIDSLGYAFRVNTDLPSSDYNRNGFDVYIYCRDLPETGNLYQWDWVHYQKQPFCGTTNDPNGRGRVVSVDCATPCWDISYNSKYLLYNDKLSNGNTIKVPVARVPFATPPDKYYIKVEQRGITKTVLDYFSSLKAQTESNGTLFDVPSQSALSPNIKSATDPTERVLGVLNVYSSRSKIIYLDMKQIIPNITPKTYSIPPSLGGFPAPTLPCEEGLYRTRQKPEGWIE